MNANRVLLQNKYSRVIEQFAQKESIPLEKALDIFYNSMLYRLMSEGVSDLHCMSDAYLAQELEDEVNLEKHE